MIVDTSALLAVMLGEPDRAAFAQAMAAADRRLMSTTSFVEAGLKLITLKRDALRLLDDAVEGYELTLADVTPEQAREAVRARARYGGRPAQLNFGDCLVYALAKTTGEPLLYKGGDFAHTDVQTVPLRPL